MGGSPDEMLPLTPLPMRLNNDQFHPLQPADYADADALHRFIERAKSRRIDTFSR
jgi:hypothetical protein